MNNAQLFFKDKDCPFFSVSNIAREHFPLVNNNHQLFFKNKDCPFSKARNLANVNFPILSDGDVVSPSLSH